MYVQRAMDSERAGEWNTEASGRLAGLVGWAGGPSGGRVLWETEEKLRQSFAASTHQQLPLCCPPDLLPPANTLIIICCPAPPPPFQAGVQLALHPARGAGGGQRQHEPRVRAVRPQPAVRGMGRAGAGCSLRLAQAGACCAANLWGPNLLVQTCSLPSAPRSPPHLQHLPHAPAGPEPPGPALLPLPLRCGAGRWADRHRVSAHRRWRGSST